MTVGKMIAGEMSFPLKNSTISTNNIKKNKVKLKSLKINFTLT